MTRLGISCLFVLLLGLRGALPSHAETPRPVPDFREVYDLIREHLAETNQNELNRLAVQALVTALNPRVSIVAEPEAEAGKGDLLVSKSALFDGPIAYVRISRVGEALDKAVRQAWQDLGQTNKLNGMVIDLRYAGGSDYAAAAATADLFVKKEQGLLDWGQGLVRSKEKTDNIAVPLAVLVNKQTMAAAEALAAVLRETGAGLILGSRTAGQAMIAQEYPLKDGERLRIATAPVQLADGSSLSWEGLKPDIAVEVAPDQERLYYADAFKELGKSGSISVAGLGSTNVTQATNRIRRPRFNEAELVRERRDGGLVLDSELSSTGGGDNEKPVVRDPALARALDFLRGLIVVRQTRS